MSNVTKAGLTGFAVVEAIRALERNGVLEALDQPATAAQLGQRLGLPLRPLELTLPILCTLGYLERAGELFRRAAHGAENLEALPNLEAFVRSGQVGDQIDRPGARGDYYAKSVIGLGEMFQAEAALLAEQLRPVEHIVDVGAGSAIWSLSMAARQADQACQVTTIDRPEVAPSTLAAAELIGFGIRPDVISGDYFEVEIEGPVDRIVMANVLHLESATDAARLIAHHARALAPDGELVVVDMFGGDDLEQRLSCDAYQLHLGMRSTVGRAHTEADLRAFCADAGLTAQRVVRLGPSAIAALICAREAPTLRARETTTIAVEDLRSLQASRASFEARFQMVFEGAADAMLVVDKRAQSIVRSNAPFRALLQLDWGSTELRELDEVVAPQDRARCRQILRGLAEGSITERRHSIRMLRGGQPFNAELAVFDPLARSVMCCVVRDRDRMFRDEKLQALGELVGGLTHDLNTPLGVLKSSCALASRIAERLRASRNAPSEGPRELTVLDQATRDALRALDRIQEKLGAIRHFATLEGPALKALAPHFDSGLALAICQRAASDPGP